MNWEEACISASDMLDESLDPAEQRDVRIAKRIQETTENTPVVSQWRGPEDVLPVEEALKRHEVSPVVKRFGTWAVTSYGVECLATYYPIEKRRLLAILPGYGEYGWIGHMEGKAWVVLGDFARAYEWGRNYHGGRGIAPRIRFAVFKRDGYRCQICGRTAADGVKLHVDHKTPVVKGGGKDIDNLWTLCHDCNQGKAAQDL